MRGFSVLQTFNSGNVPALRLMPGSKQALQVRNNVYLLLSYASLATKYWCAHFTVASPTTGNWSPFRFRLSSTFYAM